jgi:hypothetical protein
LRHVKCSETLPSKENASASAIKSQSQQAMRRSDSASRQAPRCGRQRGFSAIVS